MTRAVPIATRCCSPPLSVAIERLRTAVSPRISRTSSTLLRMTSGATLRASMLKANSSSTISVTNPLRGFCPTIPTKCASAPGFTVRVEIPSTEISPARIPPVWWGTRPLISLNSEDLPEPVSPMTKTISPSSISNERSSRIVLVECG